MDMAVIAEYDKNPEENLPNSMDGILVNYGTSFTNEERNTILYGRDKEKSDALKSNIKTCTVPEFLAIDPQNLTNTEQKIQTALRRVYEINEKKPPLYEKFPNFRSDTCPLTIDITTVGLGRDCSASYQPRNNTIEFVEIDNPISLVGSIAHELKHAENETEEVHELKERLEISNHYGLHQLRFLDEASAYACGERASYEAGDTDYNSHKFWHDTFAKEGWTWNEDYVRQMEIRSQLEYLYDSSYKDKYDSAYPIEENDAGLDHIPEVFHISNEDVIKTLKETPRIARTPENRLNQLKKNNHHQEASELILDNLSKGERIDFDIDYLIEHCPTEKVGKMFNLQAPDGKPLMDKEKLLSLFSEYMIGRQPKKMGKNFQELLNFTDITSKDYTEKDLSRYARLTSDDLPNLISRLPIIVALKGKDGKPLIPENELVENLHSWSLFTYHKTSLAKDLFRSVSDENGNLPVGRELFDIPQNSTDITQKPGSNLLLDGRFNEDFLTSEEDKKEVFELIPLYMSLKDKNGKPIISPENIQAIPKENRTLISAIKAYKRQQLKDRLKSLLSFGSKQTENTEIIKKEWKEKIGELKLEKKMDKKGRSDTLKKLLKASSNEGKKEALKEFHSQQSPAGVKRRTALKFDR